MKKVHVRTCRVTTLVLTLIMVFGILPQTAYAADPTASAIISSTDDKNIFQSADSRSGILNSIQVDTLNTGNYQINDVVTLSDGFLYIGFDNTTGNEMACKVNFAGTFQWQNSSFSDLAGTTQIRGAVEVNGRLFISGYARDPVTRITNGFICELNQNTGALIPDSTGAFLGRSNGAVSDGSDFIYIAGSEGLHSYEIAAKTITTANPTQYHYGLAYIPQNHSVVAVCRGDTSNTLVKYYSPTSNGVLTYAEPFFTPNSTDYIWSVYYRNGYLYTIGQDGSPYVGKFSVTGADLGRQMITSGIADTSAADYHTLSIFSTASAVYFDSSKSKIYILGSGNYPNRNGKPTDPSAQYFTPFNALCFYEFNAGADVITNEYVKVWNLLDLNLHGASNIYKNAAGKLIICGTTQQGNAAGDTTNRMFYLTAELKNEIDKAPAITAPKTIISYTNMTDTTGLITNAKLKQLLTFADDRTSASNIAASFKLESELPTTGTGTSDVYFSVTDQCGNKTIGKISLIREIQVTKLTVKGPDSVRKTTSDMPTASYTVDVEPEAATNPEVTWSSSKHAVATIDPKTGLLTAVGFGSTVITAESVSNPAVSATKTITVKNLYDIIVSPVNGATDVPVNGNISITFEEAMDATPGIVSLNEGVIDWTGSWSDDKKTYTIPYTGLSFSTSYTVKVENFKDISTDTVTANVSNSFTTISAVKAAKAAAENAVYTPIAQAAATDKTAIQTHIAAIANAAIGNADISVTVNELSYTEAIAGTSANAAGTDGAYAFTITVSNGVESETTVEKTLVVTATAYIVVADENAVAAARAAIVEGEVFVAPGAAQEAKTQAVQAYVNRLLDTVPDAFGVTATVSFNSGSTYTVMLSKGSAADSLSLIMTVTETADPDYLTVSAAMTAAENAIYAALTQDAATDEATVRAYIKSIATAAVNDGSVLVTVNTIRYLAAVAGTYSNADGVNGEYVFTCTVSKGGQSQTTQQRTLTIIARKHAYSLTVVKGTGGGLVTAGTVVNIRANTPQSGWVFDKWTSNISVLFANAGSAVTTFAMPNSDVTITAVYRYVGVPEEGSSDYIPRTVMSGSSNIILSGSNVHKDAQLSVSPLTTGASHPVSVVIQQATAEGQLIAGYDIKLSGGFLGEITLSFPVGAEYNGQVVTILHYINGGVETYTTVVSNGVATIKVNSLSPFLVLRGIIAPGQGNIKPPATGEAAAPLGFIMLGFAAACAFRVIMRRHKS